VLNPLRADLINTERDNMPTKITSIEKLKNFADGGCECFILLRGCLKSSKHIMYDKEANEFDVVNYIDGSLQSLTEKELMDKEITNIGYAMTIGALYLDN